MKDIQEIMKEMNVVTNEVAVTVAQVQQVLPILGLACNCADACSGVGGLTACGIRDLTVDAGDCIITAPRNFTFNNSTANSRLAYSLTDLSVLVEPCACNSDATTPVYAIRIVGSIPYTVNVPLNITPGNCYFEFSGTTPISIPDGGSVYGCCCCGNVPVNNILGFTCSLQAASFVSALITATFLTCEFITPGLTVVFENNSTPARAIATVTFNLPDLCGTPALGILSKK